jgi:hypothetical protein
MIRKERVSCWLAGALLRSVWPNRSRMRGCGRRSFPRKLYGSCTEFALTLASEASTSASLLRGWNIEADERRPFVRSADVVPESDYGLLRFSRTI